MSASPFTCDAEIIEIGEGLLARTLEKPRWTHAAHFSAAVWLLRCRPDIDLPREMPGIISAYNVSVGGVNSDSEGYHETITQASILAARVFLARLPEETPLFAACNALVASPLGDKDWLFAYWSRPVLFSKAARLGWVEPDIQPLPF